MITTYKNAVNIPFSTCRETEIVVLGAAISITCRAVQQCALPGQISGGFTIAGQKKAGIASQPDELCSLFLILGEVFIICCNNACAESQLLPDDRHHRHECPS